MHFIIVYLEICFNNLPSLDNELCWLFYENSLFCWHYHMVTFWKTLVYIRGENSLNSLTTHYGRCNLSSLLSSNFLDLFYWYNWVFLIWSLFKSWPLVFLSIWTSFWAYLGLQIGHNTRLKILEDGVKVVLSVQMCKCDLYKRKCRTRKYYFLHMLDNFWNLN